MSQINVNNIKNRAGTGAPTLGNGVIVTGVVTATTGAFSGNVSIGGTLTYEDVTNIDVVGIITARSDVSIADKIVHTGDTNTAIRFPAADTFTVETAGSERVRVGAGGSVGIGTEIPAKFLEVAVGNNVSNGILVKGNSSPLIQIDEGTGVSANFALDSNGSYFGPTSNHYQVFRTNSVERLRIDSTGRIGINTSSFNDAAETLRVQAPSGQNNTHLTIKAPSTSGFSILNFGDDDFNEGRIIYDHSDNSMQFRTDDAERMRITSTGGIHFNNAELIERVNIVANKLSAAPTINLDNGMIHHFTTTETTTATPNITSTAGINTNMAIGDAMSVTIVTTAAAAGYAATVTIDHLNAGNNGGSLNWTGGSAPSDGGASGVDIYAYTLIKTADAKFTVIATQTKTS